MGFFAKLFGKKKKDESYYLKTNDEIKKENEIKNSKKETKVENVENDYLYSSTKENKPKQTKKEETKKIPDKNTDNSIISDDEEADKITQDRNTKSIKSGGPSGFFDIKKSKDGRFVFNLYASNRVIIATSQIYSSSQSAMNGVKSVIVNAAKAAIEDSTLKTINQENYPKWEIYKDKAEQFRFRLCASNGSCVCHSQGYTTKSSCKNGIESIIRTVKDAKIDKSYLKKE